jgi:hypothetical protein
LSAVVRSDVANSFYSVAKSYSPLQILSHFEGLAPSFPAHAATNMPGKILLFHLLGLLTGSTQRLGYLVILVSSLGAPLLYGICKLLFHSRRAAFYAFILYALIPSKLFFFPILNTVTPVWILGCFYLFLLYLESKHILYLALLGAALYFLILFEPTPLATGILFAAILIKAFADKRVSLKDAWRMLAIPVLAFLTVYVLFEVLFSFNLFQAFQLILRDAVDFNARTGRGYWIWVWENSKEFFFAAGLPVIMLFIFLTVRALGQKGAFRRGLARWPAEKVYLTGLLLTYLVLLFLGINRGETTRLWIYLAVFFQVPPAVFLAKIPRSRALFLCVACTLAVQAIVTLQNVSFIEP